MKELLDDIAAELSDLADEVAAVDLASPRLAAEVAELGWDANALATMLIDLAERLAGE